MDAVKKINTTRLWKKRKLKKDPSLCITCLKRSRISGLSQCSHCLNIRRNRYQMLKEEVLNAYGGLVCACCGETESKFLCLDHINNDRSTQCKELNWKNPSSGRLYGYLKNKGFPKGYQVLCWNCNRGKWSNVGICPHKTKGR